MDTDILFIFISIFFLAFFSAVEIVFPKTSPLVFDKERKKKQLSSLVWARLIKNTNHLSFTLFFGKIIAVVILGFLLAAEILKILNNSEIQFGVVKIIFLVVFTITLLISVTELLPRLLNYIEPNRVLQYFAILVILIYGLLYPLTWLIVSISSSMLALFGLNQKKVQVNRLSPNLISGQFSSQTIEQAETELEFEHNKKLFQNALDFSKVKLRECTIPRNEVAAVELDSPIEKLKEKFIETGYSKILVYNETIDHIIGYAESSDLFQNPKNIKSMLKNLVIAPETMAANKLLNLFMKEHKSIALIVDEFGGTAGIVTIEDIMEEIFGEIEDEHDSSDFKEEKISNHEYIFSGRLEIDYLNEKYDLSFPESEDYETIAGYILHHHEEIPNENDKMKIGKFEFEILKMQNPKIELIKVKIGR